MFDPISIGLALLLSTAKDALQTETAKAVFSGIIGNRADHLFTSGYKKIKAILNLRSSDYPENHDLLRTLRMSMLKATEMLYLSMKEDEEEKQFRKKLKEWVDEQIKFLPTLSKWADWENPAVGELELFFTGNESHIQKKMLLIEKMISSWDKYLQSQLKTDIPQAFILKLKEGWIEDKKRIYWHEATMVLMIEALRNPKDEQSIKAAKAFEHNFLSDIKLQLSDIHELLLSQFANNEVIIKLADTIASQQRTIETQAAENKLNAETINLITKKQFELEEKLKQAEAEKAQLYLENKISKEIIDKTENDRKELTDFYQLYPERYKAKIEAIQATKNLEQLVKEDDEKIELRKKLELEELRGSAMRRVQLGQQLEADFKFTEALVSFEKAIQTCPSLLQASFEYAKILHTIGQNQAANEIFQSISESDDFIKSGFLFQVDVWDMQAQTQISLRQFKEAIRIFNIAGNLLEKYGEEVLSLKVEKKSILEGSIANAFERCPIETTKYFSYFTRLNNNIGSSYTKLGDYERAIYHLNGSLESAQILYGEEGVLVATCWNNLGDVLKVQGKPEEAKEHFLKALDFFLRNGINKHLGLPVLYENLSSVSMQLKNYDDAINYADTGVEVSRDIFGNQSLITAHSLMVLGHAFVAKGDRDKAWDNYSLAQSIYESTEHKDGKLAFKEKERAIGIVDCYSTIANFLMDEQNDATDFLTVALSYARDIYSSDSIKIAKILSDIATCYFYTAKNDVGKLTDAVDFWQESLSIYEKHQVDEKSQTNAAQITKNIQVTKERLNKINAS